MFCTQCGKELPDGSKFCPQCGKSLGATPQRVTATPVAQGAVPMTDEPAAAADVAPSTNEAAAPVAPAVLTDSGAPVSPAGTTPVPAPKNTKLVHIAVAAAVVAVVAVLGLGIFAYLQFFSGTPIDEEHFPDKAFCSFVATNLDTDGNGKLSAREIEKATVVDLSGQSGIADVTGVAVFTSMESFNLGSNTVETVDLSQNASLKEINTQAAVTENVHVPSGFTEHGGTLVTGNTNVYEGPDESVVLSKKSTSEGVLGPVQDHKGTLYIGAGLYASEKNRDNSITTDGTPFFKNTDLFLYADEKVFWLETTQATSFYSTVIYMANEDGANQKQVAQYAHMVVPVAYTNGWLFYSKGEGPTATNVETGETRSLKGYTGGTDPYLDGIVGVHDGNVVLKKATDNADAPEYLLVSPNTWEVVGTLQAPTTTKSQYSEATEQGILNIGANGNMSMVDYSGNVLWSKVFDFAKSSTDGIQVRPYCSNTEAFFFPAKQEPAVQIVNLENGDVSTIAFEGLEKPKTASVYYGNDQYVYVRGENAYLKVDRASGKILD